MASLPCHTKGRRIERSFRWGWNALHLGVGAGRHALTVVTTKATVRPDQESVRPFRPRHGEHSRTAAIRSAFPVSRPRPPSGMRWGASPAYAQSVVTDIPFDSSRRPLLTARKGERHATMRAGHLVGVQRAARGS